MWEEIEEIEFPAVVSIDRIGSAGRVNRVNDSRYAILGPNTNELGAVEKPGAEWRRDLVVLERVRFEVDYCNVIFH